RVRCAVGTPRGTDGRAEKPPRVWERRATRPGARVVRTGSTPVHTPRTAVRPPRVRGEGRAGTARPGSVRRRDPGLRAARSHVAPPAARRVPTTARPTPRKRGSSVPPGRVPAPTTGRTPAER